MRSRPMALMLCSLIFLYFPLSTLVRWFIGFDITFLDFVLSVCLPLLMMIGLLKVSTTGWYTLVAGVALWGIRDLYDYYASTGSGEATLIIHLVIYVVSLGYFINPRVRQLYFDPKMRWWRAKPRFETHLPMMLRGGDWSYPVMRNISDGGCFLETSHLLKQGERISLCIPLPVPLNVSVIRTEGEVRWVSDNPLRHGLGVQFVDPNAESFKAIREYVRRQL